MGKYSAIELHPPGFCSYYICKFLKIRAFSVFANTLEGSVFCVVLSSVLLSWRRKVWGVGVGGCQPVLTACHVYHLWIYEHWQFYFFLFVTGFPASLWWLMTSKQCWLGSLHGRHLVSFVNFKESISDLFISNVTTALAPRSTFHGGRNEAVFQDS